MISTATSRFTVVDLFCGAGGLSEGFRQAGATILCGTDHDPDAIATYAYNFPEAVAVCGDIRKRAVRKAMLKAAEGCDVLIGGPPCQAFSQVRNHARLIDDPRNSLYREFVWAIRKIAPVAFVMENVPGMDQMGVREQVIEDLSLRGQYEVTSRLVDAANFGVPQTRERLIFMGVRCGSGVEVAVPAGSGIVDRLTLLRDDSGKSVRYRLATSAPMFDQADIARLEDVDDITCVSVAQAIGDLAKLEVGNRTDTREYTSLTAPTSEYQRRMRAGSAHFVANVQVPRMREDTRLRLKAIPAGGNYRDLPEPLTARYITGEKWGQDNGTGRLARKHYYAYRKLHPDLWAWTLNTKADSAYHYAAPRALSVREFARLQSFPDRFVVTTDARKGDLPGRVGGGAAHSRYRQIGNAVPPLLAFNLATTISDALASAHADRAESA